MADGEPVDIPAHQFVSVRVEMPVDSIWNQKQTEEALKSRNRARKKPPPICVRMSGGWTVFMPVREYYPNNIYRPTLANGGELSTRWDFKHHQQADFPDRFAGIAQAVRLHRLSLRHQGKSGAPASSARQNDFSGLETRCSTFRLS
ncbi:hypothetical protein [Enterobacter hormaechei]|uniref:hypothetical protein n=1 Tax=Enterobacter hormaechei TaxID=158836 RepID=UPI00388FD78D